MGRESHELFYVIIKAIGAKSIVGPLPEVAGAHTPGYPHAFTRHGTSTEMFYNSERKF